MSQRVELPKWSAELWRPHRYKSIRGGRGAGRSWSVARVLLLMAAREPKRILCAREFQSSIRDSVHRLLRDQIGLLGVPGYNVAQGEISHSSGSLFLFEGIRHNVTKIKSLEGVDVVWVEEAESVSEDSWEVLIPTIRKSGSEIWATWNPRDEEDPTYRRFVKDPPPDCWSVEVSSWDNPWLPKELKAEREYLYRVDPDAAAHVWGGSTRKISDAQVLRGRFSVEAFSAGPDWVGPMYGGDWGYAVDPTALVRCWVDGRTLYVEHEAYAVGCDIDDTPRLFATVPGAKDHVIRADNARPETIAYLKRHGYPKMVSVIKGAGSVEDGVEHLRSYERIVIHPRCKNTAQEARLWSWKVNRLTGDVLPELVDKHNHCWDAIRYALQPLIRRRQSITVGIDPNAGYTPRESI